MQVEFRAEDLQRMVFTRDDVGGLLLGERPRRRDPTERLPLAALSEDILGVTVGKVIIPVAAGRNLAVLVEAAVRNEILKLRGIDSTAEFLARQKQQMEEKE